MRTIFRTQFGSHLYGTNTPTSDLDFKGVFLESLENIVLNKDQATIHQDTKSNNSVKNTKDDIDIELIELRKFIKDCLDGQTYALDMIFSPQNMWSLDLEEASQTQQNDLIYPIWQKILDSRHKLLSKQVKPYIGYCRQQAGKYGLKGSRLGELLKVINFLESRPSKRRLEQDKYLIKDVWFKDSEFVEIVSLPHTPNKGQPPVYNEYLKILGKHFPLQAFIKDVLPSLYLMNDKYGERAKLAQQNEGVDWKAISHAYRCMFQLIELAETGCIIFPLKDRDYLKELKSGKVSYEVVQNELPVLMEKAIQAVKESSFLPETPDYEFWDSFLVQCYLSNGK